MFGVGFIYRLVPVKERQLQIRKFGSLCMTQSQCMESYSRFHNLIASCYRVTGLLPADRKELTSAPDVLSKASIRPLKHISGEANMAVIDKIIA